MLLLILPKTTTEADLSRPPDLGGLESGANCSEPASDSIGKKWVGVKPAQMGGFCHTDHMAHQPQHSVSQLTWLWKKQADASLLLLYMLEARSN